MKAYFLGNSETYARLKLLQVWQIANEKFFLEE